MGMMVFSGYNADKGRIQEGDEANAKNKIAGACFKWASMNGFLKLRRDPGTPAIFYAVTLPHTALPYITTLEAISPILEAQPFINKLIYDMSLDQEFIESVIGSVVENDDFSSKLYKIYKASAKERSSQKVSFGIFRSDYFPVRASSPDGEIQHKMVEVNCISASFPGLIPRMIELHKFLNGVVFDGSEELKHLPEDGHFIFPDVLKEVGDAIALAHGLHGRKGSHVLFVPQEGETNIYDQTAIELYLIKEHKIPVVYSTLRKLAASGKIELRSPSKDLYVKGKNISVVYFRSAYSVDDYPSEECWSVRLKIEISSAIKCPDIFCHLVGMKKFQEALANPKYLDKFVHSKRHSSIIKNTAVKFYPLNNAKNIRTATQLVANNPRGFVLKPQREGGGNNLFGTSALDFISNQKNLQLLSGYTLMDMINPIESVNYLVSGSTVQRVPCVSELGVYGIWLSFNGTIHLNKHAGILVRSKTPETTEGGVCAGGGYLSSLYVVPTE